MITFYEFCMFLLLGIVVGIVAGSSSNNGIRWYVFLVSYIICFVIYALIYVHFQTPIDLGLFISPLGCPAGAYLYQTFKD